MSYSYSNFGWVGGIMYNESEYKILKTFLYKEHQKFSEIEKAVKVRSNKLAYYLNKLTQKKVLNKTNGKYRLSETGEYLVPYLSRKKYVLAVVLIHIGNSKKAFMYTRKKRPFKDKLSMPGGRLILGETILDATKRIMAQDHNINAKLKTIHSVSTESIKKSGKKIQTDLIIFVSATTNDKIKYTDIEKNKSKIISSDYKLLKNDLGKKIEIKNFITLN